MFFKEMRFSELYAEIRAKLEPGKLPRMRVISWADYCEQILSADVVRFPPPLTDAQIIAYADNPVANACINDRGECLTVLGTREADAA